MTQLQSARKGIITPEMSRVAQRESVTPEFIRDEVAHSPRATVCANRRIGQSLQMIASFFLVIALACSCDRRTPESTPEPEVEQNKMADPPPASMPINSNVAPRPKGSDTRNPIRTASDSNGSLLDAAKSSSFDCRTKRSKLGQESGIERLAALQEEINACARRDKEDAKSVEQFLLTLTRGQRILMAVAELEAEVNNGGFDQYFSNSAGGLAIEAADSFRALGLPHFADLVTEANSAFPKASPPRDREVRQAAVEKLGESRFSAMDSRFIESYKAEEEIAKALNKYIDTHPNEFYSD